ncbi:cyclin family protein [Ascoidea rubescens DSM 1968]|uniref:A/B/D/E cyclin n=1 Tax=Ascoidea rubescens DSM 1968 TaxID=1344418 RepID=A0A1D2VKE4_9ASCO|nr:A/B/D/E cyclin [Ascoidea rubescens DSM 1968]ODV62007.1 A/B/D/E cyclin [Ascoidea rubescens DSM 1968]
MAGPTLRIDENAINNNIRLTRSKSNINNININENINETINGTRTALTNISLNNQLSLPNQQKIIIPRQSHYKRDPLNNNNSHNINIINNKAKSPEKSTRLSIKRRYEEFNLNNNMNIDENFNNEKSNENYNINNNNNSNNYNDHINNNNNNNNFLNGTTINMNNENNNFFLNNKKPKITYNWDDLDLDDFDDPLMVNEYVVDIFNYLTVLEQQTLPDANYLIWQSNLKPRMRSIIVDWLVEVHLRFRLLPETLFIGINLMDRFLSKEIIEVDKFQLLAISSLFISAKYQEICSPSIKNFSYVTDGGFSEEDILNAEKVVLAVLEFNMSYPNPLEFLRRISKADNYDVQTRTLGKYLLEISVIDYKFIGLCPSLCAAGAMYISRKILKRGEWNGNLIHYSGGYKEKDLRKVCEMIVEYLISPIVHEEFFKKYSSKKYMRASVLARQWAKKITMQERDIME